MRAALHPPGRAVVLAVAICAVVQFAAGCTPPPRSAPTASGVRWELSVSPYRPAALQAATLQLRAFDAAGRPIVLQGFRATASMPEMDHRGEMVAFREMETGLYEAVHTFSMDGRWEIHVTGSVQGKRAEVRISLVVGR